MHSTNDLNDDYLGSGYRLRRSIKKYGRITHSREILELHDDRQTAAEREKEIIAEHINDRFCMNLAVGGEGGWDFVNEHGLSPVSNRDPNHPSYQKVLDGMKRGRSNSGKIHWKNIGIGTLGYKYTDEQRRHVSLSHFGERNSQFGTKWMMNLATREVKKVKANDVDRYLLDGWRLGRK